MTSISHYKFPESCTLCDKLFDALQSKIGPTDRRISEEVCSIGGKPKFAYVYHQKRKLKIYILSKFLEGFPLSKISDSLQIQKRIAVKEGWSKVFQHFIYIESESDINSATIIIEHIANKLNNGLLVKSNDDLDKEILRLIALINQDVDRSGDERTGNYPLRSGLNNRQLYQVLIAKWREQQGLCALCGGIIPLHPVNRLFQMSRDRVDSAVKVYDASNLQITHLGCNLAKNDTTLTEWEEFLGMIRNTPT